MTTLADKQVSGPEAANGCSTNPKHDCGDTNNRRQSSSSASSLPATSQPINQDKISGLNAHPISMGKFKEKRPEPLNLNPSLNQDIPLDLSVKSAGNAPSGGLGNIFNSNGQTSTLVTPRIFWQENEALLIKPRLFSSSNSHKIQLASFASDSPPITPNTPYMDLCSPTTRSTGHLNSAFMSKHHKFRLDDDNLSKTIKLNSNSSSSNNKTTITHNKTNELKMFGYQRSCSTDNLSALSGHHNNQLQKYRQDNKISSISPLVNESSQSPNKMGNRFSYCSHTKSKAASDEDKDSTDSSNNLNGQQSMVQSSLANATANLLNIHLSSPTNQGPMMGNISPVSSNGHMHSPSVETRAKPLTTTTTTATATTAPSYLNRDSHHHSTAANVFASSIGSLGSSTTLNTPTLISPSHLKSCFLPSPILSPMSSVFELPLPSPLLVYPSPQVASFEQRFVAKLSPTNKTPEKHTNVTDHSVSTPKVTITYTKSPNQYETISEPNLTHLVTPAKDKVGTHVDPESCHDEANEDVEMEHENRQVVAQRETASIHSRPASVIPFMPVSDLNNQPEHQTRHFNQQVSYHSGAECRNYLEAGKPYLTDNYNQQHLAPQHGCHTDQVQNRVQRDYLGKRALSPQSYRTRISIYHNERHGSSSAPPDVNQIRACPKVKSATESRVDLVNEPQMTNESYGRSVAEPTSCHQYRTAPAYPEMQACWMSTHLVPVGDNTTNNNYQQLSISSNNYQQLSISSNNCSQSAQHLHASTFGAKPAYSDSFVQHQYQSSVSMSTIHRVASSHNPASINSQLSQTHHSTPASRMPLNSTMSPISNNNNIPMHTIIGGSSIRGPNQATIPSLRPELLSKYQSSQVDQQQGNDLQPQHPGQPRALSADGSGIPRSESSCSAAEFCFRSSSAASGGASAKKYHCNLCSKAFTRSDMLTRHKRLHSGDRPFQCNECRQEFSRSDHLSTHMRTHTGEKPYRCKLCSYSACRKDMITRHMKVHNKSSLNV